MEESTDGFRAPARPRGGYEVASPAGRPLVPAALGAAQVVSQLLAWSFLMPSYDTTLTGAGVLHPWMVQLCGPCAWVEPVPCTLKPEGKEAAAGLERPHALQRHHPHR